MTSNFEEQQLQLKALANQLGMIPFLDNSPENEIVGLAWSIYGVVSTNDIVAKAAIGEFAIYASRPSPLAYPYMADRIFGMDVADEHVAVELSHKIWRQYEQNFRKVIRGNS